MSLVGDAMELHGAPYHGIYHAVDCAQTLLVFLNTFGADKFFSPLEAFALLIAALCHDLEHPGLSVTYQENAQVCFALCLICTWVVLFHYLRIFVYCVLTPNNTVACYRRRLRCGILHALPSLRVIIVHVRLQYCGGLRAAFLLRWTRNSSSRLEN